MQEQANEVAKELVDYEAEMNRVMECAEVAGQLRAVTFGSHK